MKKFVLPGLLLMMACSNSRGKRLSYLHDKVRCIAWNQDIVVNFRLVIFRDKTFLYTTEDTVGGRKTITGYGGHVWFSNDTIHLIFKGKKRPPMCDYLINASGGYLSQQFTDHRKLMYLRRMPAHLGLHALDYSITIF